jgi:thiamine phosphate synthase YjbQ (UPF0047 family)
LVRQARHELVIVTRDRGFYEFTDNVAALVTRAGLQTGVATLPRQHTSASLLIQENADPQVRRDLERFFARLALGVWQGIYHWEHRRQPHRRRAIAPNASTPAANLGKAGDSVTLVMGFRQVEMMAFGEVLRGRPLRRAPTRAC